MTSRLIRTLIGALTLLAMWVSGEAADGKDGRISFNEHIKPILRQHCLKCHGNDEQNADLNLEEYGTLLQGGSAGVVVKPGNPDASLLLQAITASDASARMPPESPPLPRRQVELIRKWIKSGLRRSSTSKSLASSRTIAFDPVATAVPWSSEPPPMPETLPDFEHPSPKRRLPILAMAANPRSNLLAVSAYQHIRLFDIARREEIGALPFPEGVPHVLRFSRNGAVLMAAGGKPVQSGSVVLFDVRSGKRVAKLGDELDAVLAADISPDQQQVALGGSGRVVKVYSTRTGRMVYKLNRHTDWIMAVAFSPDGKQLASADRAGGIHLWDAAEGAVRLSLSSHKKSVRALAWRSDSRILASGGEDGRLTWWNAKSGFIAISHANPHPPQRPSGSYGDVPNGVLSVAFASDGRLLTAGRDLYARYWDAAGKQLRGFKFESIPTQVAVSHDAKMLILGSAGGRVHFRKLSD